VALQAINVQLYRFSPDGPYDTGLSVKTEVTINASGSSNIVTQDAAHASTDYTTANANGVLNPNAKANSATRLYVKNSEVSLSGLGFTYIGHVTATNVGGDPETFTLLEAASCTIPVGAKLYSHTLSPMLNGRILDVLAGTSASVTGIEMSEHRGQIVVAVAYA